MKALPLIHTVITELAVSGVGNKSRTTPSLRLEADDIWSTLIFCILSSQVSSPAASKATSYVAKQVAGSSVHSKEDVYFAARRCLSDPEVSYRFPERGANLLASAWTSLRELDGPFDSYLGAFDSEFSARDDIVSRFAGLGMKQASMFLRDIGFSRDLAIIDVHVYRYLTTFFDFPIGPLTRRRYLDAEIFLLDLAKRLGTDLLTLDCLIWTAMRTHKEARI